MKFKKIIGRLILFVLMVSYVSQYAFAAETEESVLYGEINTIVSFEPPGDVYVRTADSDEIMDHLPEKVTAVLADGTSVNILAEWEVIDASQDGEDLYLSLRLIPPDDYILSSDISLPEIQAVGLGFYSISMDSTSGSRSDVTKVGTGSITGESGDDTAIWYGTYDNCDVYHKIFVTYNGKKYVAYCIETDKENPKGTDASVYRLENAYSTAANKKILKALYYGYTSNENLSSSRFVTSGLAQIVEDNLEVTDILYDWNSTDGETARKDQVYHFLTHAMLAKLWGYSEWDHDMSPNEIAVVNKLLTKLNSLSMPADPKIQIVANDTKQEEAVTAYIGTSYGDSSKTVQRTKQLLVRGDASNSITLNLPDGVVAYVHSQPMTGNVTIGGGTIFHLEAPVTMSGSYIQTNIKGKLSSKVQPYITFGGSDTVSTGAQDLAFLFSETYSGTTEIRINWVTTIRMTAAKIWDDHNNVSGKRPESILVDLYKGAVKGAKTTLVTTVTLNKANNWTATVSGLPQDFDDGSHIYYTFYERVPDGYSASVAESKPEDGHWQYTFTNTPDRGYLQLVKASETQSITDRNGCYSLAGAVYTVYDTNSGDVLSGEVAALTTDELGYSQIAELAPGEYYLKETVTAPGYQLDDRIYTVEVTADSTEKEPVKLEVTDRPWYTDADIRITKFADGEMTAQCPSLEGTQFTVCFYEGYYTESTLPDEPARTWVIQTKDTPDDVCQAALEEECKISGDEFYEIDDVPVLPLGTITIQETLPAVGYTLKGYLLDSGGRTISTDSEIYVAQITEENEKVSIQGGSRYSAYDTPVRGSVRIVKYGSDKKTPLQGVGFELKDREGNVIAEGNTDSEGLLVFDGLYPDQYILTETKTLPGYSLLTDSIEVTVPVQMTEEEIRKNDIDIDSCIYDEGKNIYYVYEIVCEISNGVSFSLPATGGKDDWMWVPVFLACAMFTGMGYLYLGKRKHSV